jgi:hypothetical protein
VISNQGHVNPAKADHAQPVSEWTKRAYIPSEDEDALVYLWCASYLRSLEGIARGAHLEHGRAAEERTSPAVREAARKMWAEQAPLVELLLSTTDVQVVCDPARPLTSPAGPAVIWGFASTTGDVVHYVCVKRDVVKAGFGADIVRDLLGDRLERACTHTHDLVEMRTGTCGVRLPRNWGWDSLWLPRRLVGLREVAGANGCVRWSKKVA